MFSVYFSCYLRVYVCMYISVLLNVCKSLKMFDYFNNHVFFLLLHMEIWDGKSEKNEIQKIVIFFFTQLSFPNHLFVYFHSFFLLHVFLILFVVVAVILMFFSYGFPSCSSQFMQNKIALNKILYFIEKKEENLYLLYVVT